MIRDETNDIAGLFLPDDPDGHAFHDQWLTALEDANFEVVDLEFYPVGTNDFSSYISRLESRLDREYVEILWGVATPGDLATLLRQMKEYDYKPKFMVIGRGAHTQEDVKAIGGDLASGICHDIEWSPKYPYPGIDWLKETWTELETGQSLGMVLGYAMHDMIIIEDALERAGSLDPEAINKAIEETGITGPAGTVDFDPETHGSMGPYCLGQWQKTPEGEWEQVIVWSPDPAIETGEMIPFQD